MFAAIRGVLWGGAEFAGDALARAPGAVAEYVFDDFRGAMLSDAAGWLRGTAAGAEVIGMETTRLGTISLESAALLAESSPANVSALVRGSGQVYVDSASQEIFAIGAAGNRSVLYSPGAYIAANPMAELTAFSETATFLAPEAEFITEVAATTEAAASETVALLAPEGLVTTGEIAAVTEIDASVYVAVEEAAQAATETLATAETAAVLTTEEVGILEVEAELASEEFAIVDAEVETEARAEAGAAGSGASGGTNAADVAVAAITAVGGTLQALVGGVSQLASTAVGAIGSATTAGIDAAGNVIAAGVATGTVVNVNNNEPRPAASTPANNAVAQIDTLGALLPDIHNMLLPPKGHGEFGMQSSQIDANEYGYRVANEYTSAFKVLHLEQLVASMRKSDAFARNAFRQMGILLPTDEQVATLTQRIIEHEETVIKETLHSMFLREPSELEKSYVLNAAAAIESRYNLGELLQSDNIAAVRDARNQLLDSEYLVAQEDAAFEQAYPYRPLAQIFDRYSPQRGGRFNDFATVYTQVAAQYAEVLDKELTALQAQDAQAQRDRNQAMMNAINMFGTLSAMRPTASAALPGPSVAPPPVAPPPPAITAPASTEIPAAPPPRTDTAPAVEPPSKADTALSSATVDTNIAMEDEARSVASHIITIQNLRIASDDTPEVVRAKLREAVVSRAAAGNERDQTFIQGVDSYVRLLYPSEKLSFYPRFAENRDYYRGVYRDELQNQVTYLSSYLAYLARPTTLSVGKPTTEDVQLHHELTDTTATANSTITVYDDDYPQIVPPNVVVNVVRNGGGSVPTLPLSGGNFQAIRPVAESSPWMLLAVALGIFAVISKVKL